MFEIRETAVFTDWLSELRDDKAVARIEVRIRRLSLGNPGDAKSVGEGVNELRIDYGPGYRVYYKRHGDVIIILLCGGNKSTQHKDIERAKQLAKEF
jgi:putative addiction module killer protein